MTKSLTVLVLGLGLATSLTACGHRDLPSGAPAPAPASAPADPVGAGGPTSTTSTTSTTSPTTPTSPTRTARTTSTATDKGLLDQLSGQASQAAATVGADLDAASPGPESDPTS